MFSARFSAKYFRQLRFFPHHPALAALMLLNSHLTPLAGESGGRGSFKGEHMSSLPSRSASAKDPAGSTCPPDPHHRPATSHRRSRTRYPPLLLGRDHNHHDQRQNAEKQTKDAPAEWVAALGRCDQRAHDRRDNAADQDENSLDAAQNETCGLRLAVAGQQQLMKHDDLLDAERGHRPLPRGRVPGWAAIKLSRTGRRPSS